MGEDGEGFGALDLEILAYLATDTLFEADPVGALGGFAWSEVHALDTDPPSSTAHHREQVEQALRSGTETAKVLRRAPPDTLTEQIRPDHSLQSVGESEGETGGSNVDCVSPQPPSQPRPSEANGSPRKKNLRGQEGD